MISLYKLQKTQLSSKSFLFGKTLCAAVKPIIVGVLQAMSVFPFVLQHPYKPEAINKKLLLKSPTHHFPIHQAISQNPPKINPHTIFTAVYHNVQLFKACVCLNSAISIAVLSVVSSSFYFYVFSCFVFFSLSVFPGRLKPQLPQRRYSCGGER